MIFFKKLEPLIYNHLNLYLTKMVLARQGSLKTSEENVTDAQGGSMYWAPAVCQVLTTSRGTHLMHAC